MKTVVYGCYALLSVVLCFFIICALSESASSAVIGVLFFVLCAVLYTKNNLVKCIIDSYARISMHIVRKFETLMK